MKASTLALLAYSLFAIGAWLVLFGLLWFVSVVT